MSDPALCGRVTNKDMIDTSIGRLTLVPDYRFTATTVGATTFSSTLFPLRVFHNGEPLNLFRKN